MSAFVGEGTTGPADDRPLTDQEYQLLQRLLSDPFSLPQQFKTWLVSYLEGSDLTLPISAILGLSNLLGISGAGTGSLGIFPAGIILPWGADLAPTGALLCDGAGYATGDEPRLFDVIKYRYGGSGASFNVPDMRGRVPVGKGAHSDHDTLGKNDGYPDPQRRAKHAHDAYGWHNTGAASGTDVNVVPLGDAFSPGEVLGHDHHPVDGLPAPVGSPAYVTINFVIIK